MFKDIEGKYGITQAIVKDVMYDNYLADKVYEVATNNVDVIVKESESRVPVVKQIEVLFKGYVNNEELEFKQKLNETFVFVDSVT